MTGNAAVAVVDVVLPVRCPRCRLPHAFLAQQCGSCGYAWEFAPDGSPHPKRQNHAAASALHLRPVDSPAGAPRGLPEGAPSPPLDLCGPEVRVVALANELRRQAYWRAVREVAQKTFEQAPHDRDAQCRVMREWWTSLPSSEDEEAPAFADVALSPANILMWTASASAYKHNDASRLVFQAAAGPVELLTYLAEMAFFHDVQAEVAALARSGGGGA